MRPRAFRQLDRSKRQTGRWLDGWTKWWALNRHFLNKQIFTFKSITGWDDEPTERRVDLLTEQRTNGRTCRFVRNDGQIYALTHLISISIHWLEKQSEKGLWVFFIVFGFGLFFILYPMVKSQTMVDAQAVWEGDLQYPIFNFVQLMKLKTCGWAQKPTKWILTTVYIQILSRSMGVPAT